MKKVILCMIIAILIVFTASAIADEAPFTIHNGTTFGMSIDEVKRCEAENNFEYEDVTDNGNFTQCFYHHTVWSIKGVVAGEKGSKISYHFDDNGLASCNYIFSYNSRGYFATDVIDRLGQKYGEIDSRLTDAVHKRVLLPDVLATQMLFNSRYKDVGVWRIPTDNSQSILITYVNFTWESGGSILEYFTGVGYELYEDKMIEQALSEYESSQEKAYDDL